MPGGRVLKKISIALKFITGAFDPIIGEVEPVIRAFEKISRALKFITGALTASLEC
jgi:hypothetical protein